MPRDPFRNFNVYKIDPLSEIRNAGIITNGDVYWVSSVSDSAHTTRRNELGRKEVKETVQQAVDAARDNNNDYVMVIPTDNGTARRLGTAIDVNKDRLHVLGVGYKPAPMAYNGLTFDGYAVASGVDTELVNVTGAGVELGGLKFLGTSGTHANGTITALMRVGTAASGTPHDLWAHDLHVENNQAAAANGTAFIVNIVGDVAGGIAGLRFERSWLGNWSFAPASVVQQGGTAGPTRAQFHDCTFIVNAQATTDDFVVVGTGQTEYQIFKNCDFINVNAGTAPASALTGAVLAGNPVLLRDNSYVNVTQAGTDTEAYKVPVASGTSAAIRDYGIAVGTAALTPV